MFRSAERFALTMTGFALVITCAALVWSLAFAPRIDANRAALLGRGDYQLQTTTGAPFTQASLRGAPSAVFFGFTHCPEVCPTTMGDIATWKEAVPEAAELQVFFVTVDPGRDTLEQLAAYTDWIPGMTGVTGPDDQIGRAISAFEIYARRIDLEDGDYTMDHSAFVLLFDDEGLFVEAIPYQAAHEAAEDSLRNLMAGNPAGRGARLPDDLIGRLCFSVQDALS